LLGLGRALLGRLGLGGLLLLDRLLRLDLLRLDGLLLLGLYLPRIELGRLVAGLPYLWRRLLRLGLLRLDGLLLLGIMRLGGRVGRLRRSVGGLGFLIEILLRWLRLGSRFVGRAVLPAYVAVVRIVSGDECQRLAAAIAEELLPLFSPGIRRTVSSSYKGNT
jgi:hypothetical protein